MSSAERVCLIVSAERVCLPASKACSSVERLPSLRHEYNYTKQEVFAQTYDGDTMLKVPFVIEGAGAAALDLGGVRPFSVEHRGLVQPWQPPAPARRAVAGMQTTQQEFPKQSKYRPSYVGRDSRCRVVARQ